MPNLTGAGKWFSFWPPSRPAMGKGRTLVVSALTALALAACGGSAPAAGTTQSATTTGSQASASVVRMGASQNITTNAPVWITQQAQLFQKNGANVDLQSISATTAIKQLVAGQLDGVAAGAPESVSARAAGSPIQIVAVFQTTCDMELVAPNDITSVNQLKGKTIGVITKPSVNGICTVADLRKHGMEPDRDYKIIESGSATGYGSLVATMQAHNVDAAAIQPDLAHQLARKAQVHTLYDLATEPGLLTASASLTFSTAFIQAHPDQVQKVLDTLLQGEAYYKQHKDEAKGLLTSMFKVTDQTALEETYNRQVQLMAKNITPREELFPDIVAALAEIQPDIKTLDLSSLLVQKFAQNSMDRGLTNF